MASKAGVGFSELSDSLKAGTEAAKAAMAQAKADKCNMVLVFSTPKHDPAKLRDGIRSVVGASPMLLGGFSVGIITSDKLGYEGYQVGVAVIESDSVKFDTFIEGKITEREKACGEALGKQIMSKQYNGDPNVFLVYDSVKGRGAELNLATPLLEGMEKGMGKWPAFTGIGLLGDMQWNRNKLWYGDQIVDQAAMALVMSGGVRMDTVIMHGCKPSGGYHKITKADGAVVLEIDGRPALDVIAEMLGPDADKSWEEYPLFITLGVNKGDKYAPFNEENYANRLCMAVDKERKGLVMFEPDLVAGTEVQLMRRSIDFKYIAKRAEDLYAQLGNRKPFFALYIDCAGRASIYCGTDKEEAEEVQNTIGKKIPLLGMYSGVEIAKVGKDMQPLDWTGVLAVFSE